MKLHTKLEIKDMWEAAGVARVQVLRLNECRSRSHDRAFDVILSGSGRRGGQWGGHNVKSAMWDEWGIFLGELYRRDPGMKCVGAYDNAEHFHWATDSRFESRTVQLHHHKWKHEGYVVRQAYYATTCACGALKRWGKP